MGQKACEMMMQRAALIAGISGAVVVVAAASVHMVVMDVASGAGVGDIGSHVFLIRYQVLEMHTDQRHDAGQLGNQKQPQKPAANSALDAN
jgi:hypothetical protein